jgi:hypothetical protein
VCCWDNAVCDKPAQGHNQSKGCSRAGMTAGVA